MTLVSVIDWFRIVADEAVGNRGAVQNCRTALCADRLADEAVAALSARLTHHPAPAHHAAPAVGSPRSA